MIDTDEVVRERRTWPPITRARAEWMALLGRLREVADDRGDDAQCAWYTAQIGRLRHRQLRRDLDLTRRAAIARAYVDAAGVDTRARAAAVLRAIAAEMRIGGGVMPSWLRGW